MIEALIKQTKHCYQWVNELIKEIPEEKWDVIPKNIESSITWQIGHLIMSVNYHTIIVIKSSPVDLYGGFPVQEFADLFTKAPATESVGKTTKAELLRVWGLFQKRSLETISELSEESLGDKLEPFIMEHPIAKSKQDAIEWNIQHTMWHCGQIAILKRFLEDRQDFGL